jgi:hypothetical protein
LAAIRTPPASGNGRSPDKLATPSSTQTGRRKTHRQLRQPIWRNGNFRRLAQGRRHRLQSATRIKRPAFIIKYSGKLSGDKITGKCEFDVNGQTRALEWKAQRETAKAAAASGNWNTALILGDGNRIEGTLKLKQDGDKLIGATVRNENETQIQDGKIAGDEITFTVIRDRDGRKVTAKYKGKITGDTVKGKVESDWSGDWQTLDWEGTRGK